MGGVSNLKLARMSAKIRQSDLAKEVGVSVSLITQIENLKARPSLRTLQKISRVLRVPLEVLAVDFENEGAVKQWIGVGAKINWGQLDDV